MPVISFDLDGVIIQNPFASGVLPRIRAHFRTAPALADVSPEDADKLINGAIREAWGSRMDGGRFVEAYDWDSIYAEVGRKFGASGAPGVADLVEECCQEEGMISVLPGAREGLISLREAGFELVAATNGYFPYQMPVLEALGIAELFDSVLSPDRVGFAKPDPNYFTGVPDLMAHVGDTLEHDVLGARRAGLTAVWLAADLPDDVRGAAVGARVHHPAFGRFLEQSLERSIYRRYHDDAEEREYVPDFVIHGAFELQALGEVLLASTPRQS